MPAPAAMRARFIEDGASGASPQVMLLRLFDRLLADLARGAAALRSGEREASHKALINAQGIVNALMVALDGSDWEAADNLRALYSFLLTELAQANVKQDADRVDACFTVVEPLRDAWNQAATSLGAGDGTAPVHRSLPMGGMTA
ncbi:flagellar protein FliS [Quadrisphaera granulorum]|uniref:Flagellar protein FliS n=1 Tax=Quadrisphaera granulorum TaxID=317664 RepID=A0A316A3Y1_9ACTN|nr:flagellar export chaperone FliS [Quadrisphaera granulorum]PWJ52601.1 flagellar protein FliS [Quadrisphaera granulorum]SZE97651.1 flagellar protein FliS [Quadrisphaera granulorum]